MALDVTTLSELLPARARTSPGKVGLRRREGDRWVDRTWGQLWERADRIAAGLLTATELRDGDVVGLLGQTSEDWIVSDFGALSVGLQTVPIYASVTPEEVGYAHVDTGIAVVIVDDAAQLAKIREMRGGFRFFEVDYTPEQLRLAHVVVINPAGLEPADDWESLADLEARGAARLADTAADRERRRAAARPDQTATYTYTSGTTGPPKAVIQTHDNHLSMVRSVEKAHVIDPRTMSDGGLFLFLPLAHSFGRLMQFAGPWFDLPLVVSGVPTLADDLKATRPSFFPGAPRVFEKMKSKVQQTLAAAPPLRQRLVQAALSAGYATIPYRSTGRPLPLPLKIGYRLADKVILGKLRAALGFDRARVLLSGSAPLDPEVHRFFLACGLELIEAYGLTETCPGLSANLPGDFRVGTVGRPLPGVEIRIAPDGEILARGPNITKGYLNRPDANADAFEDGWFKTGDLGALDPDGFLKITGRKKELIKTSGGKYVAPARLEGRLKNHPIIQEAVVIGDRRHYVVALVALDPEELETWARAKGASPDPRDARVQGEVEAHVRAVNQDLARFETVKYFRLLPEPLSIANGLLTASLKVKRNVVEDRYAHLIDEMYQAGGGPSNGD